MSGRDAGAVVAGVLAAAVGLGGAAYAVGLPSGTGADTPTVATTTSATEPPRARRPSIVVVGGRKTKPHRSDVSGSAPRTAPASSTRTKRPVALALCAAAARQREVEAALSSLEQYGAMTVDGRQSSADCAAIRRFQRRFGIAPANGQADDTTADVAQRIVASSTPQVLEQCDADEGVTACVNLSLQTAWVVSDGDVVLGPTVVRTGFRGHRTPTGTYPINKRALREWSGPYRVWLPYWQRFVGGIGFHETTTYLHDSSLGSHGCVNLLRADAVEMWSRLRLGTTVRVVGRRAGT